MPDTKHNILRQLGAFACCFSVRKSPIIDWIAGACIFCVYVSSLNRSRGHSPVQSSPFSGLSQPKYPRNQLTRSRLIKYISFIIWQLVPGRGGGVALFIATNGIIQLGDCATANGNLIESGPHDTIRCPMPIMTCPHTWIYIYIHYIAHITCDSDSWIYSFIMTKPIEMARENFIEYNMIVYTIFPYDLMPLRFEVICLRPVASLVGFQIKNNS